MNTKELIQFTRACINANVTGCVIAPPGVGKTAVMRQVAEQLGRPLVLIEGAYIGDETSLQGIPFNKDGKTAWLPPESLEVPDNAIIFIDEITSMRQQQLIYSLLLEKRIDTRVFPDSVNIMCAGNREEDGGAIWSFNPVIGNRMAVTLEYKGPSPMEWVRWAIQSRLHPLAITAVQYHPTWLHNYKAERPRNATPRSWEIASRFLAQDRMPVRTALTSTLGSECTAAVETVIENLANMANPALIMRGQALAPSDPMAAFLSVSNFDRFLQGQDINAMINTINFSEAVIQRHGRIFVSPVVDALAAVPKMNLVPAYRELVARHSKYV